MKSFRFQNLLTTLGNVLLALCLLALTSGPVHAADAVINNRISIDFSPYIDGQDPNSGTVLSEAQIRQRMQIIAPYSKWIRSFSCGNGLEVIGRIAHEMNLQVAVNAWIGPSPAVNQQQISCLINQANAGYVDLAIVGSEALLRGDVSADALIGYIDQVRQAIPVSIPVTTADVYGTFLDNPLLVDHIDLIFANIFPFWEGYKVQNGVAMLNYSYNQLVAAYPTKTIEISETGWPSCGSFGDATGSLANEALYFSQAESWAYDKNVTMFYFDALDESWKTKYEGPQGGCWGIWNKNGVMKAGMAPVFDGTKVPYDLTLPSTCETDQLSFEFTYVPPYGSYDNVHGQTCGIFHKDHQVILYIKVNGGWWVKPYLNQPATSISADGTWSIDYTTGGVDQTATEIRAYLVPTNEVGTCSPISDTCGYPMISATRPTTATFSDVPVTNYYSWYIEVLYAKGLTGGCSTSPLKYCPDQTMNRGAAAVFILRGNFGNSFVPNPATHILKDDWTKGTWAEPWAEAMYYKGLSAGCTSSPLKYCPWDQIPREQAVIFALRLKYGNSYAPPPATGTVFADMTNKSYYATSWAEQAYKDGIIQNCGMSGGKPKFCPKMLVSRGLGAYMIVRAKNLSMP